MDMKEEADTPSHYWLLDSQPTTSKAAAAQALALQNSTKGGSSIAINEINFFATKLCDVLLECLHNILSDQQQKPLHILHNNHTPNANTTTNSSGNGSSNNTTFSQQFTLQYCRLACHFVKVFHQLCFNSRLEDSLYASVRFTLNACESKLLNEYYNLLMMYSTQGCPTSSTTSFSSTTATAMTTATLAEYDVDNSLLQLQLEMYNLLNDVGILDPFLLLQRLQLDDISNHVRRSLLNKVCHQSNVSTSSNTYTRTYIILNYYFEL